MALTCLKWMMFVLIITATFLFGLALLMVSVLVLAGVLMGSVKMEESGAEVCQDIRMDGSGFWIADGLGLGARGC